MVLTLPTDIRDPLLTLKQLSIKLKTVTFTRAYYTRPQRIRYDLCVIRTARYTSTYIHTNGVVEITDMDGHCIKNVTRSTSNQHVATKNYVDKTPLLLLEVSCQMT